MRVASSRDGSGGRPTGATLHAQVPDGFLARVFSADRRRILRFESGLALDPHLRRLSGLSGAVDRALALRLRRLRDSGGYVRLGYARFSDYSRERVGLAVRTVQEMIRLGKALERSPELDRALRAGRITWTAAAKIASVSGEFDAAEWVSLAERVSVRELGQRVRAARSGERPVESTHSCPGGTEARPSPAESDSEEQGAADDRERPAGEGIGFGGNVESGAPDGPHDQDDGVDDDPLIRYSVTAPASTVRLWEVSNELCEMLMGGPTAPGEVTEYVLADFLSGVPNRQCAGEVGAPALPSLGARRHRKCDGGGRIAHELADSALPHHYSRAVERALGWLSDPVSSDPFEVDTALRDLTAARRGLDLDLARMLGNFHSLGLARHLGFSSFGHYVEERLGISVARARFLVLLDRRLSSLSRIRRAVRRGTIGTVAAMLIGRVARPGRTEELWIERARRRTVLRLRKEVDWASREYERQSKRGYPPLPPDRLTSALELLTESLLRSCAEEIAAGRCRAGSCDPGLVDANCEMSARSDRVLGRQRVKIILRESSWSLWHEARRHLEEASELPCVCDETVLREISLAFLHTHMRLWLEEVVGGDPVAVRDGFCCQIPGCSSRCGAAHHLRFRSQGGPDELWNLLFVCPTHHLAGIHRNRLRVWGRAPDRVPFELGIRADGSALEVFAGHERLLPESVSRRPSGSSESNGHGTNEASESRRRIDGPINGTIDGTSIFDGPIDGLVDVTPAPVDQRGQPTA